MIVESHGHSFELPDNLEERFRIVSKYFALVAVNVDLANPNLEDPAQRSQIRRAFDTHDRKKFLLWLCSQNEEILRKHGFNFDDYDRGLLALGRMDDIKNLRSYIAHFNVDHILSIKLGGTNDFQNLCVVPKWMNYFKGTIENLQTEHGIKKDRKILTFYPPAQDDGTLDPWPLIPEEDWYWTP